MLHTSTGKQLWISSALWHPGQPKRGDIHPEPEWSKNYEWRRQKMTEILGLWGRDRRSAGEDAKFPMNGGFHPRIGDFRASYLRERVRCRDQGSWDPPGLVAVLVSPLLPAGVAFKMP